MNNRKSYMLTLCLISSGFICTSTLEAGSHNRTRINNKNRKRSSNSRIRKSTSRSNRHNKFNRYEELYKQMALKNAIDVENSHTQATKINALTQETCILKREIRRLNTEAIKMQNEHNNFYDTKINALTGALHNSNLDNLELSHRNYHLHQVNSMYLHTNENPNKT